MAISGRARGEYFHYVAAHAERRTGKIDIFARILQFDEPPDQLVAGDLIARAQRQGKPEILFGRTEAIDARHARHDKRIRPFAERCRGGVAELIYLVVYGHILFDISIRARDIAFRLIIVVIRHEIFHAVVRKKLAELIAKLRRERLVVRDDERRAVDVFDDVRHRKRFAAARDAHEHLRTDAVKHPFRKFFYRLRLISRRLIRRYEFKFIHNIPAAAAAP